jgi:hypothetical protein
MRIRTVKPSFLRHEQLQDLEIDNPGQYVMMVFLGLWMLADSKGRFEYKPRSMKLDILPFITFDIQLTLDLLEASGFIRTYTVDGNKYGMIPSFKEHQRLTGKELTEGEKYPDEIINNRGNIGETPEKHLESQEGKGREREKEGNKEGEGIGEVLPPFFEDKILSKKIMDYFDFTETANFDKLREVSGFLKCLFLNDKIKYFESQFSAYAEYKKINNSWKHSFKKFLGSHEKLFDDGAWNAENWIKKLEEEKSKGNGKINKGYSGRRSNQTITAAGIDESDL